jgi:hypothetical protein
MSHLRTTTSRLSSEVDASIKLPECEHGPALKFDRTIKDGTVRAFYACSAVRDRKECPLFYWADEWAKRKHSIEPAAVRRKLTPCTPIPQLGSVSFMANAESQSASQFFFDAPTLNQLIEIIKTRSYKRILCIGCPTIAASFPGSSTLLDIDDRLPNVIRYNMFTNHFFIPSEEKEVKAIEYDLVVCDPPFQPELLTLLGSSIKTLAPKAGIMLAFPCFHKDAVFEATKCKITDLRLGYENHKNYRGIKSPVRLFTNIVQKEMHLGEEYEKCVPCGRFVHKTLNKHCKQCKNCTTVHGAALYRHCRQCNTCVKPGYVHCIACKRCCKTEHKCMNTSR